MQTSALFQRGKQKPPAFKAKGFINATNTRRRIRTPLLAAGVFPTHRLTGCRRAPAGHDLPGFLLRRKCLTTAAALPGESPRKTISPPGIPRTVTVPFPVQWVINGERHRASKLLPAGWSKDQAHAYDRQEISRLYAIISGVEKPKTEIAEAVKLDLDLRIPGLANGTKTAQDLAHLIPYINGKFLDDLGNISKQYCKDHPHLSPATLHNRLAYLKAAVRYAYKNHDVGDRDYTDKMIMPEVNNKRHVYIKQEELHENLLTHCEDDEARAVFTLAFYTGLRWRSEILTLKPDQIVTAKRQKWISLPDTKNGTPHMIPIHPNAVWALAYIPFKWKDSYYYARWWKARSAAGLEHVRIHDERHSFASALLSNGASLAEVGRALNHKSTQSTDRYSHLYPEPQRTCFAPSRGKKMRTTKIGGPKNWQQRSGISYCFYWCRSLIRTTGITIC